MRRSSMVRVALVGAAVLLTFSPLPAVAAPFVFNPIDDAGRSPLLLVQRGFRPAPHIELPHFDPPHIDLPHGPDTFPRSELNSKIDPSAQHREDGRKLQDTELSAGKIVVDGREYRLDSSDLTAWQDAVGARQPPIAFIVARVNPELGAVSTPLYLLITGAETRYVFSGNGNLRNLAFQAELDWVRLGGETPARLAMVGDGSAQDFDAALLTMRLSNRDFVSNRLPLFAAFESLDLPPEYSNLQGFAGRTHRVHAEGAAIEFTGGHYVGTSEIHGSKLTVVGRTREAVAIVLAAIRRVISEYIALVGASFSNELTPAQRTALVEQMRQGTEAALHQFYIGHPDAKTTEDTIQVDASLGNEIVSWSVAESGVRQSSQHASTAP